MALSSSLRDGHKEKETHVLVDDKTTNYAIADDLTAPPTEPAGSVAPHPGAGISASTAETWPVGRPPANGRSSRRRGKRSCGLERGKTVSALSDRCLGARKLPRSSCLTGSGALLPRPAVTSIHAVGERTHFSTPAPQTAFISRHKRSTDHRLLGHTGSPRLLLPRDRRGLASLLPFEQPFSPARSGTT